MCRIIVILILVLGCVGVADAQCGGDFNTDFSEGFLLSPNYPSTYVNNQYCKWTISMDEGSLVQIVFYPPFGIEESKGCAYDNIQIFDVLPSGKLRSRGAWCGQDLPPVFLSSTSKVEVQFQSDATTGGKGFSAKWTEVVQPCRIVLEGMFGNISSPDYPSAYPDASDCRWDIFAPKGYFIELEFRTDFDLGLTGDKSCDNDRIEVFDALADNSLVSHGQLCGSDVPPRTKSFGSELVVMFHSDSNNNTNGRGFYATWRAVRSCDQEFTATKGNILSYHYGREGNDTNAFGHVNCTWEVNVPVGFLINLKFEPSFNDNLCNGIKIQDIYANGRVDTLPTGWCGTTNGMLTSLGHRVKIDFQPGGYVTEGFRVTWNSVCGDIYYSTDGNFSTPNFPAVYGNDLDCRWEINAGKNHLIKIEFGSSFELEASESGCDYDYLEVFDVVEDALVSKGKFCGHNSPPELISYFSKMVVLFHSDSNKGGRGFSATWDSRERCGGVYYDNKGNFSFPNVDSPYQRNMVCTWEIHVDPKYHNVKLSFSGGMDIGQDSLQVSGLASNGQAKFVRNVVGSHPKSLSIGTSFIKLTFNSYGGKPGKGFEVAWKAVCGEVLTASSGNISSPNYGVAYPPNLDCEWTIVGAKDHLVNLNFQSPFELEVTNDGNCGFDHVEVFDQSANGVRVSKGKYCGHETPAPLISSTYEMVVRFHSDLDKSGKGFFATWDTACGEVYTSDRGVLESPHYPQPYPDNFECRWEIRVSAGRIIRLSFNKPFELETTPLCDADYVELFDYSPQGSLISKGRLCGFNVPQLQASISNRMMVVFHSDLQKNSLGFRATWDAVCGDVFNTDQGFFTSPGFPSPYPDNLDCRWEINVNPGRRIELEFDDSTFDLELSRDKCAYDDVEVIDYLFNGTSVNNGRWCGIRTLPVFTSVTSKLAILFHSDGDKHGRGFNVSWTTVGGCGDTFVGRKDGFLASPNFPVEYPVNQMCQWEIHPPGGANVILYFDQLFDIEAGNDCAWDRVQVYRGSSSVGKFCGNTAPGPIASLGQTLKIVFVSDKSNSKKGFYASWMIPQ